MKSIDLNVLSKIITNVSTPLIYNVVTGTTFINMLTGSIINTIATSSVFINALTNSLSSTNNNSNVITGSQIVTLEQYYHPFDNNDWSAAFMRAQLANSAGNNIPLTLQLSNRDYSFGGWIDAIGALYLKGNPCDAAIAASGQYGGIPRLLFPSGSGGIRCRFAGYYQGGTYGNLVVTASTAYGSQLVTEGIVLQGDGIQGRDKHGIYTESGFIINNTIIQGFGGDGFHAENVVVGPIPGGFCAVGLRDTQSTSSYSLTINGMTYFTLSSNSPTGSSILSALVQQITNTQISGAINDTQRVKIENAYCSTPYHMTVDGIRFNHTTPSITGSNGSVAVQTIAQNFVTQINNQFGNGTVSLGGNDSVLFTGSHSVIETGNNMILYGFYIVNTGSILMPGTVSCSNNLMLIYQGSSNVSYASRLHSFSNLGNGIYIHGNDANQSNFYQMDVQSCGQAHINDNSFLGNKWYGCHVASDVAANSVSYMTAMSSKAEFFGCYTEGGVPGYFNKGSKVWGGTAMAKVAGLGGVIIDDNENELVVVNGAVRGSAPSGDGARLGSPSTTGRAFSIICSNTSVPDVNTTYQAAFNDAWEQIYGSDGNSGFEGVTTLNHLYNPQRKIFQKGFAIGGGLEPDYQSGGTPAYALRTFSNGGITCKLELHDGQVVSAATNATPIVINTNGGQYISGSRVLIQAVKGNTTANGMFMVHNPSGSQFVLHAFDGTNIVGNGNYTFGGYVYQANLIGWSNNSPVSGNWAKGDVLYGTTSILQCTGSGVGSGSSWRTM